MSRNERGKSDPPAAAAATVVSCSILALGPFSKTRIALLGYSESYYQRVPEGMELLHALFITEGNAADTRLLAACFGIRDPLDFNQHEIDPQRIDLNALKSFCMQVEGHTEEEAQRILDCLRTTFTDDFRFFMMIDEISGEVSPWG